MSLEYLVSADFAGPAVFVNPAPARGVRAPRRARVPRETKPVKRVPEPTVVELRAWAKAMGLNAVTAHTKRELHAMILANVYVRPAAYDKQNAKRKADRLASRAAAE